MRYRSKRRLEAESGEGENCINVNLSLKLYLAGPAWKHVYLRIMRLPTMDIKLDRKITEFEKWSSLNEDKLCAMENVICHLMNC